MVLWSLEDGGAVGKGVVGRGGCHHCKIRRAMLAEYGGAVIAHDSVLRHSAMVRHNSGAMRIELWVEFLFVFAVCSCDARLDATTLISYARSHASTGTTIEKYLPKGPSQPEGEQ